MLVITMTNMDSPFKAFCILNLMKDFHRPCPHDTWIFITLSAHCIAYILKTSIPVMIRNNLTLQWRPCMRLPRVVYKNVGQRLAAFSGQNASPCNEIYGQRTNKVTPEIVLC